MTINPTEPFNFGSSWRANHELGAVSGAFLFYMKATRGFPLEMAVDMAINDCGYVVTWADYIEEARRNGRYDFQTVTEIEHATQDADLPQGMSAEIVKRAKLYVMKHPRTH